jgi:hypothetical protein
VKAVGHSSKKVGAYLAPGKAAKKKTAVKKGTVAKKKAAPKKAGATRKAKKSVRKRAA